MFKSAVRALVAIGQFLGSAIIYIIVILAIPAIIGINSFALGRKSGCSPNILPKTAFSLALPECENALNNEYFRIIFSNSSSFCSSFNRDT